MVRLIIIILVICFAASRESCAQDVPNLSDTTLRLWIKTTDDNEFTGKIKSMEDGALLFQTDGYGLVTIRIANIKRVEKANPAKIIEGVYWMDNFQSTRYFISPNGFALKPGEAYYQNMWIFFNQFNIGVTKNFSVGLGTVPIYLLGARVAPVWITPKVSIPVSEKLHVGVGALYGKAFSFGNEFGNSDGIGVVYGTATFGDRDKNVSLGMGYGFYGENFTKRPAINGSMMQRLGPRFYLISENYLVFSAGDGFAGLLSVGGRRLFGKTALDFGWFAPVAPDIDKVFLFPWLAVSCPLGKRHFAD